MKFENENTLKNQKGQGFVEFIFLMLVIVTISFSLLRGVRTFVGGRWELMVKIIAAPNQSDVNMP